MVCSKRHYDFAKRHQGFYAKRYYSSVPNDIHLCIGLCARRHCWLNKTLVLCEKTPFCVKRRQDIVLKRHLGFVQKSTGVVYKIHCGFVHLCYVPKDTITYQTTPAFGDQRHYSCVRRGTLLCQNTRLCHVTLGSVCKLHLVATKRT